MLVLALQVSCSTTALRSTTEPSLRTSPSRGDRSRLCSYRKLNSQKCCSADRCKLQSKIKERRIQCFIYIFTGISINDPSKSSYLNKKVVVFIELQKTRVVGIILLPSSFAIFCIYRHRSLRTQQTYFRRISGCRLSFI